MLRILLLINIFLFFIWTATEGQNSFHLERDYVSSYNLLAKGFLQGQLNLPVNPPTELLNLKNPYDPIANAKFRELGYHDFSLYKGKFYLYFAPLPALILYLPYRVLTGHGLPDNLVCFIFISGIFIWLVMLIIHLKNSYFKETPEWMLLVAILLLSLCNLGPYILRGPCQIYEVAVTGACFFLTGAIYWLCKGVNQPTEKNFMLAGVFLGLAVGCRVYYMFSEFILITIVIKHLFNKKVERSILMGFLGKLLFPTALCLIFTGIYNYFRFDSLFEVGALYQIGLLDYHIVKLYGIEYLKDNVLNYIFRPLIINSTFPFIHIQYWASPVVAHIYKFGRLAGFLTSVPFLFLLIFSPILLWFLKSDRAFEHKKNALSFFPKLEFLIILIPSCLNLVLLQFFHYTTMRYLADFLSPMILAGCIIWFYIDLRSNNLPQCKRLLTLVAVLLAGISIVSGLAFSIVGKKHGLEEQNSDEFAKLNSFFSPISKLISKVTK